MFGWRTSITIHDGSWHHLAVVRQGGIVRVYLDGEFRDDTTTLPTGPLEIGPGGLMLGQEQDDLNGNLDPNQTFDGFIDELTEYPFGGDHYMATIIAGEVDALGKACQAEYHAAKSTVDLLAVTAQDFLLAVVTLHQDAIAQHTGDAFVHIQHLTTR